MSTATWRRPSGSLDLKVSRLWALLLCICCLVLVPISPHTRPCSFAEAASSVDDSSVTEKSPMKALLGDSLYVWGELEAEDEESSTQQADSKQLAIYEVDTDSMLEGKKYVLLYFSASWCKPCQNFTPKLANFYQSVLASHRVEIVWVSSDRSDQEFVTYFQKMPWLAVPMKATDKLEELRDQFSVAGIPYLVVLDTNGQVLVRDAVKNVLQDPSGITFPWQGVAHRVKSFIPGFIKRRWNAQVASTKSALRARIQHAKKSFKSFLRGILEGWVPRPILRAMMG